MNKYNDISIHSLSSSAQKEKYLLSYGQKYYEVSKPIVELVEELQKYPSEKEAIDAYIYRMNHKYTCEQVQMIIDKFIAPIFTIKVSNNSFIYERKLFSADAVNGFSDRFNFLFKYQFIVTILMVSIIFDLYFFLTTDNLLLFNTKANIYIIIGLLVFTLISSFFHELGHASACKYFGVRHGGSGLGCT